MKKFILALMMFFLSASGLSYEINRPNDGLFYVPAMIMSLTINKGKNPRKVENLTRNYLCERGGGCDGIQQVNKKDFKIIPKKSADNNTEYAYTDDELIIFMTLKDNDGKIYYARAAFPIISANNVDYYDAIYTYGIIGIDENYLDNREVEAFNHYFNYSNSGK